MIKRKQDIVCCHDCKHAELMQWGDDPVIAKCPVRKKREVARARRICVRWEKRTKSELIKHFDSH